MKNESDEIDFWKIHKGPEAHALSAFWRGLTAIYEHVKKAEAERLESHPFSANMMIVTFGSDEREIEFFNWFCWYSTTASTFLRLLSGCYGLDFREIKKGQFHNMLKFRDKVAAHLCYDLPIVHGPNRDNEDSRMASLVQAATWDCGRYSIGKEIMGTNAPLDGSTVDNWSHPDIGWVLTETHEAMIEFVLRVTQDKPDTVE